MRKWIFDIKWIKEKSLRNGIQNERKHLPPANIATNIIPHDQISAAVALYGRTKISGATYGKVPHLLSNKRSRPLILFF